MTQATATLEKPHTTTPDCEQTGTPLLSLDDAEVIRAVRKAYPDWQTNRPTVDQVQAIDGRGRSRATRLYSLVQTAPYDHQTEQQTDQTNCGPTRQPPAQTETHTPPVDSPPEPTPRVQFHPPVRPRQSGRVSAYIGAWLGGLGSIAANVAHSYVPPQGAPQDWQPETGAVIGAMFWPIAVLVAVEIFSRVDWPAGRRWTVLRFGGLIPVAVVAALVSYLHLAGLLKHWGEHSLIVAIGPLAVDGLMVMATGALIALGRQRAQSARTV